MPELFKSTLRFFAGLLNWLGRVLRAYLMSVGFFVTMGPIVLILFSHYLSHRSAPTEQRLLSKAKLDSAMVQLVLDGDLVDHEQGMSRGLLEHLFKTHEDYYLQDLRSTFRHLAQDPRVSGVQISVRSLKGSFADFVELRRIIALLKEAKKPVHFYLEDGDDKALYLASVADRIAIAPTSEVLIPGPTFNLTYFGDALKKLGVEIEVIKVGKYKSAFEPFVANKPSPETLEEYRSLNRSMLDHIVTTIADGRGKSAEQVRGWFHQSIFSPSMAKLAGIVDAIAYFPVEADESEKAMGAKERVDYEDYVDDFESEAAKADATASSKAGVAIIEAIGEIHMAASGSGRQEGIDPERIRKQVDWALQDDDVKAVLLRVSSPGGSALASDLILQDLQRLAVKKPIVVSMGTYAASGGYWISMAAKRIFAEPLTITGSIGVISMRPSMAPFEEKYGISFHTVTESERVGLLSPGGRSTVADRSLLNQSIDEVYQLFLKTVSTGRNISLQKVGELAQGRVYTGSDALKFGLIDELGGLNEAFAMAKELGGLDRNKLYPVLHYEEDFVPLKSCLKSSANMIRCLQQFSGQVHGSQLIAAVRQGLAPDVMPMPGALSDVTAFVTQLHNGQRFGRFLALWPGYQGMTHL